MCVCVCIRIYNFVYKQTRRICKTKNELKLKSRHNCSISHFLFIRAGAAQCCVAPVQCKWKLRNIYPER